MGNSPPVNKSTEGDSPHSNKDKNDDVKPN